VNPEGQQKAQELLSRVIGVLQECKFGPKGMYYGTFERNGEYSIMVDIDEKFVFECAARC
jgi:hypothetical protein